MRNFKTSCYVNYRKVGKTRLIVNIKSLVLVASFASILAATMVWPQTLIPGNNHQNYSKQEQVQSSTISIDANFALGVTQVISKLNQCDVSSLFWL